MKGYLKFPKRQTFGKVETKCIYRFQNGRPNERIHILKEDAKISKESLEKQKIDRKVVEWFIDRTWALCVKKENWVLRNVTKDKEKYRNLKVELRKSIKRDRMLRIEKVGEIFQRWVEMNVSEGWSELRKWYKYPPSDRVIPSEQKMKALVKQQILKYKGPDFSFKLIIPGDIIKKKNSKIIFHRKHK